MARYFRAAGIPVYGVSGIFFDIYDVRAHGKDERILSAGVLRGRRVHATLDERPRHRALTESRLLTWE